MSPYLQKSEQNGEYKLLKKLIKNTDIFVDIGANLGEFTSKALEYNQNLEKVLVFEPNTKKK